MKLYIDDERTPKSEGWIIIRNFDTAVRALYLSARGGGEIQEISLDHDLGDPDPKRTGYDIMCEIEKLVLAKRIRLPLIGFHTANPVGRMRMQMVLDNIIRHIAEED